MGKAQELTARDILAASAEVLRLLGKNLESVARRAEAGADGCLLPTMEIFDVLKFFNLIRGVSGLLTATDLADDDKVEEINRNFKMIEDFLRGSGLLDEEFAGDPG